MNKVDQALLFMGIVVVLMLILRAYLIKTGRWDNLS